MAIKGDIDHVSMITSAMGKIYRYTAKGDSLVPLAQEVEIVKSYISIQQARFEGRITTLYSISPEAAQVPVFKMLLQPLVENAFIHGLESRPSDGTLFPSPSATTAPASRRKSSRSWKRAFPQASTTRPSISAWSIFPHGCACNTATPPDCTSPARQATAHA